MANDRTLINLRGYCFYCLKNIVNEGDNNYNQSPAVTSSTPVPPSPLSTPLRTRCHNVHNLPPEERLAPFKDLCRYLGVELPDSYAFGDGSEPEVLYPPLCEKCHELSARLCILQDELQYIQTRIHNTVERIHRRVASTCDTRGAFKREEFNKDFRRKSKGSLSRGRGESSEMKKVTDLLKAFQMRIVEKDYENRERKKRRATAVLFPGCRNSFAPIPFTLNADDNIDNPENEENVQPETENEELSLTTQEYLPPEETLRCARPQNNNNNGCAANGQNFEVETVRIQREIIKPYPDLSTIVCSYRSDETPCPSENYNEACNNTDNNHLKTTVIVGVTTRSRARLSSLHTIDGDEQNRLIFDDNLVIRRRTRKVPRL